MNSRHLLVALTFLEIGTWLAACGNVGGVKGEAAVTYVNPLDLNYAIHMGRLYNKHRAPADPEIIRHAGKYWLFVTYGGGYFMSEDLVSWKWIATNDLPLNEWAPTVEEVGGRLVFSARGGTVHRAVDLERGRWEKLPARVAHPVDSALFADGNRLYLYWGGGDSLRPLAGCELDPKTFRDKSAAVSTFQADNARYGYEVRGHCNELTHMRGYIEGSHMFRHGDTYYFQCAGPGTEYASYSDMAFRGKSPLGPFERQRMNPFSSKPTGYIPSAGHGKTFADRFGNVWHVATGMVVGFNRRIVLFPVYFDGDGEMWCDCAFADWPFVMPDHKVASPEELRTGWMEIAGGKPVTASSSMDGHPAMLAVDNRIDTFWQASSGKKGESLTVDFTDRATIRSVQLGFGDSETEFRAYRIEAETKPGEWQLLIEEKSGRRFAEHPYHQLTNPVDALRLRVVNVGDLANDVGFSLRGVRVFGSMDKPKPSMPTSIAVKRDVRDRRHAAVTWAPSAGATGYLVRYGVSRDKMHLARTSKDCRLELRSLDAQTDFVWSVTAYNEAGFSQPGFSPLDRSL